MHTNNDIDNTKIGFGKYRLHTPTELAGYDPEYLVWIAERKQNFCSVKLLTKAKQTSNLLKLNYYHSIPNNE